MKRFMLIVALVVAGCGGDTTTPTDASTDAGADAGGEKLAPECVYPDECGAPGDAICVDEICRDMTPDGHGSAIVAVSFDRDIPEVSKTGLIYFISSQAPNGSTLTCADVAAGVDPAGRDINLLQTNPKMVVFNCCGSFYPNILIQFIRPANDVLVVIEGYDGIDNLNVIGCTDKINIVVDETVENIIISVDAPGY